MTPKQLAEFVERVGGDPDKLQTDQEIIDRVRQMGLLIAAQGAATEFPPLHALAGIILEFAKIYEYTGEAGQTIQGSGGFADLVAAKFHGEYLAEKFTKLIVPLMGQNREFTWAFIRKARWGPTDMIMAKYEGIEEDLDQATSSAEYFRAENENSHELLKEAVQAKLRADARLVEGEAEIAALKIVGATLVGEVSRLEEELEQASNEVLEDRIDHLQESLAHAEGDNKALKATLEAKTKELEAKIKHLQKYVEEVEW